MSEQTSLRALREEADEMLGMNATAWLDPRDLLALVEAVEAAQAVTPPAVVGSHDRLRAALARFKDYGAAA